MSALPEERHEALRMIADSAAFVASRDAVARARALRWSEPGFDRAVWAQAAELGWLGLRVPEDAGGSGLGVPELCALCEALGRGLAPEPMAQAICIASLLDGGDRTGALDGSRVILGAWQETSGPAEGAFRTRFADGRLTGEKRYVPMAAGADGFLVATADGLALVDRHARGVTVDAARLQDGGHFGILRFDDAEAAPIAGGNLDAIVEELTVATAAYLLGVARHAFEITGDYLKVRHQFGKPIGSFQALQHRMADLYVQIRLTAAVVAEAALVVETAADADTRRRAASRAKVRASDTALLVTRQGIQLHGGIGFTDEADIGLFLRKALVLANLYGSPGEHRARYSRLLTVNLQALAA